MIDYIFSKEKIQNEDIAKENLIIANEILIKNFTSPFLLYGTLLGVFRDKKLISSDNDIDIGCKHENFIINKEKIIQNLTLKGFILARKNKSLITFVRKNEHIDLYLFRKIPYLQSYFSMNFYIPSKYLLKLNKIMVYDKIFFIPQYTDLFLEYCYGSDWKIPKKGCTAKTNFFLNFLYFIIPSKVIKNIGKLISR